MTVGQLLNLTIDNISHGGYNILRTITSLKKGW